MSPMSTRQRSWRRKPNHGGLVLPDEAHPPVLLTDEGPPVDSYPVARGLRYWGVCDKGGFTNVAGVQYKVDYVSDLSGSGNKLNPTEDADISGAIATTGSTAGGAAIPQLNGRDPISFSNAWLPWPTTLFDGMTQGELFFVVKGNNGDPEGSTLPDRDYSWQLGPSDDARWAEPTGGGDGTGRIREDFGSTVLHDTGDAPGRLDDWRIYNVRAAASHYVVALDGSVIYSTSTNTVSFSTAPKLGNRGNPSFILWAEGAIHEVILTTEERALVLAKLQERWAL